MHTGRSQGKELEFNSDMKRSARRNRKKATLRRHMKPTSTPPTIHPCQLFKSPGHSPLDCPFRFESPEFLQNNEHIMQDYMYQMDMHQKAMESPPFSEQQFQELPCHSFDDIMAELEETHKRLAAKVHEPYEAFTSLLMENDVVNRRSENVSAIQQQELPPKLTDPGKFTIPCTVGTTRFERCLLDLGAAISLMPYSIYEALNVGKLKETDIIIQLADGSLKNARGVLEDVLVNVDGLIIPADFVLVDIEEAPTSTSLQLLLGRPFMRTARTKIDVYEGTLTMTVLGETVEFNIFDALRYPIDDYDCFSIFVLDEILQDTPNATVDSGECTPSRP